MTLVTEVPLSPQPQTFKITLNNVFYQLTVTWCPPADAWTLDIADNAGAPLVSGIPLITGIDLLEQYEYLGIGGSLVCQTDHDTYAVPTFTNLGDTSHLYFLTE